MEFINTQQVRTDEKAVNEALQSMSELASQIVESGLNISASEVYSITCGKLSLTKIYETEAKSRTTKDPKYVQEQALSLAASQANKCQEVVNSLRKFGGILSRLPEKNFLMNESCEFSYKGNLTNDLTSLHTKKLTEQQENFVKQIKNFQKSLIEMNAALSEISQPQIKVNIPFTLAGEVDLSKIAFIDFAGFEDKKKAAIAASIKHKEARAKQKARLEKLVPQNYPERAEFILRMLAVDPDGSKYDDETLKNLIRPDKGSFKKSFSATSIGFSDF